MAPGVWGAWFEGGKQDGAIQLAISVLPLQQGKFRVVSVAQFPPIGCVHGAVRFHQHGPHLRRCLAIRSRFGDGLAHHLDGLLHELAKIGLPHGLPPAAAIILSNSLSTFVLKSASIW
jgi:hypothetical protein